MAKLARPLRPLRWVGSSKRDYGRFPERVQDNLGFALFLVQTGQHPPVAKPLKAWEAVSLSWSKTLTVIRIVQSIQSASAGWCMCCTHS